MKEKKYSLILLILSLVFLLISVIPILHPGLIQTHDKNLYPILLYEFDQGIQAGQWLPRWSADFWLGLGSPFFNFIQPLFFYLAEIFHLIGFGLVASIKIIIIIGFVLSFISMYLFAKAIWGREGGFISAVIYTFFPYRLALVYIRGDFAEYFATALIPLILFLFIKLSQTKKLIYFLFCSLCLAFLIICHNIQTFFFTPLLIIYLIIIFWKELKKVYWQVLLAIIFSFSLASFYFCPAFFEKNYLALEALTSGIYDFHNRFLNLTNFILPKWDTLNHFQIGISGILIICFTFYLVIIRKVKLEKFERKNIYFFIVLTFITILLALPVSTIFWENFPLVKYIQFPWRVLSFQALAVAVLGGLLLQSEFTKLFFKKLPTKIIVIIFSIIIVLANVTFLRPDNYLVILNDNLYHPFYGIFGDAGIKKGETIDTIILQYAATVPLIVPRAVSIDKLKQYYQDASTKLRSYLVEEKAGGPLKKIDIVEGEVQWQMSRFSPYFMEFNLVALEDSIIEVNQFWFPGWQAYLDGKKIAINHANDLQIMTFNILAGKHNLQIHFSNTPIRTISEFISLVALIIWLVLLVKLIIKPDEG